MSINPVNRISNFISGEQGGHVWQFSRVGGVNRVNLVTGEDISSLGSLDKKLWAALSCPVKGLEIDERTLTLIDGDKDGRVRVKEVIAASAWVSSLLKDPSELLEGKTRLSLSSIKDDSEEGKRIVDAARHILKNLGKAGQTEIGVEETANLGAIFAGTPFNGDGVITDDSTDDPKLKNLISIIGSTRGGISDRGGKMGVDANFIDSFFDEAKAYLSWKSKPDSNPDLLPFGESTASALKAFESVREKIDDYFLRCRLAQYDPASAEVLNARLTQFEALSPKNLAQSMADLAQLPLSRMNPDGTLNISDGINPAWQDAISSFVELVFKPLFKSKKDLTRKDWESIPAHFSAYNAWISSKPSTSVESLNPDFLSEVIQSDAKAVLMELVQQDAALSVEAENMMNVDRLVRLFRDLPILLRNFVNFSDFYKPGVRAIFEAGELYIDQRRLDLCIRVNDLPRHKSMAGESGICLIYCECKSISRGETMTIVAALTDGDNDDITVGKNAIFYDRKGLDWDATVIHIIDNPISIRQAFWSPYKKLTRFISKQIENLAASKEKEADEKNLSQAQQSIGKADAHLSSAGANQPAKTAAPPPFDIAKFAGIFATLSIALSAIGSIFLAVVTGFLSLAWWQMPLAFVGLILSISLPSMFLAYLKLRKRNLAHLLNANGWAINARLNVNILFGQTLTQLAELPENSKLNLMDPFTKKKNPMIPVWIGLAVVTIALATLWYFGFLEQWGLFGASEGPAPVPETVVPADSTSK